MIGCINIFIKNIIYNNNMDKQFMVYLKLSDDASPHLYVDKLKSLMEGNKTIHPNMKKTLKLLKKSGQPYIMLAHVKEVVFDVPNYRHFERALEPKPTGWLRTNWSEEEKEQCNADQKSYIREVLNFFKLLGYDLYDPEPVNDSFIESLDKLTEKQK